MLNKSKFDKYIDGVVLICKKKEKGTDFSATINPQSTDDLERVVKLNYQSMSVRNQDLEFAEQSGFSLSMKIKTRIFKDITSKHMAIVDNFLYSIKYVDKDKVNMYLYLEGVRSVA